MRTSDSLLRAVFAVQVQLPLWQRKKTKASIMEPFPSLFQDNKRIVTVTVAGKPHAPCSAHYFSCPLCQAPATRPFSQVPDITCGKYGAVTSLVPGQSEIQFLLFASHLGVEYVIDAKGGVAGAAYKNDPIGAWDWDFDRTN